MTNVRALRWVGNGQARRCEELVARTLQTWLRDWIGEAADLNPQVRTVSGERPIHEGTFWQLGSTPAWALTVANLEAALHSALTRGRVSNSMGELAPLAVEFWRRTASDFLQRLVKAFVNPQMSPGSARVVNIWPEMPEIAGDLTFSCALGERSFLLHLGGELVATHLPQPKSGPSVTALAASSLVGFAANTPAKLNVSVGSAKLSAGALMQLEVGDVVVLDQSVNQPISVELPVLGVSLPAFLAQTDTHIAIEILSPKEAIRP